MEEKKAQRGARILNPDFFSYIGTVWSFWEPYLEKDCDDGTGWFRIDRISSSREFIEEIVSITAHAYNRERHLYGKGTLMRHQLYVVCP